MNPSIPDPVRGKDVLEWAVPVTRALNALHDKVGATVRNERDRRDRPPHPFEVRWFGEANDGDGAWCIYLPIPSHMVMVDGEYVPDIDGYIDAPDELPELWYYIDDAEDDAVVWLNVTVVESSHTVTAALSTSPGQGSTGVKVYPVALGTNIVEENADGVKTHRYFALVDSAVVLSTGAGADVDPDDVSTELIPHDNAAGADNTKEGELQIKGFNKGTPHASSSVAQNLMSTGPTAGHVLFRESNGSLSYKQIGKLPSGITQTELKIVTDIQWNSTTHRLEIEHATVNIQNGIITAWNELGDQAIETTAISSIIGS